VSDLAERLRPSRGTATVAADLPRRVAYQLQRAVAENGAYANLELPKLLTVNHLDARDAAFATELAYGTARAAGTLDEIIATCVDRPLDQLDSPARDLLRLGAYQLLRTRVPAHAAVASTVDLARNTGNVRVAGLLNAVLRKVAARDWDQWVELLGEHASPIRRLALQYAHPEWIAAAFSAALGNDLDETARALAADDERPHTHLVVYPGLGDRDQAVNESGGRAGPWSPYAVRLAGGDPGRLPSVTSRRAAVQDEGSQLCAIALANAPVDGRDTRWLDLCAGPGGKTALLAALAEPRGAQVTANEVRQHRADLVSQATRSWSVPVLVHDARTLTSDEGYDRVLLDAPCSGLGALRRRPEARWRRTRRPALAPPARHRCNVLRAVAPTDRPG
jgi:16S rRNA (cytosine967-C5)-methyltransferase